MLSISPLGDGASGYYVVEVAAGRDDYYTADPAGPGRWLGRSAERLGLEGVVEPEAFARVLAREDPRSGEQLVGTRGTIAAFDATLSAPKSVSVLAALGGPHVRDVVEGAHRQAVEAALNVLEPEAGWGRRGQGGVIPVEGDGVVAGAFTHRTSRAGDPQLHTHVVIANLVYVPGDGRWSALDARRLYRWSAPAGHVYQAQLRWDLTQQLGVSWGPMAVKGCADITGIPLSVVDEFSQRRHQIEESLERVGASGRRASQAAAYATRPAKDAERDAAAVEQWPARAAAAGLRSDWLDHVRHEHRPRVPDREQMFRFLASDAGVTATTSTFGRGDVIVAVADAHPDGASAGTILALADEFLTSEHAVRLERIALGCQAGECRYTVPGLLAIETNLLMLAVDQQHAGRGVAPVAAADLDGLDVDQRRMVVRLCEGGAGVDVVVGLAGSGKTTSLAAARAAWDRAGYDVAGCALAGRAASQLMDATGIPAITLHRRLAHLHELHDRLVLVVDEGAMIGTRQLDRLARACVAAGTKLVVVGDPYQLPELEAGGAHAALARVLSATTLTANRRQSQQWERDALVRLRHGDAAAAVKSYQRNDRIVVEPDPVQRLIDDWAATVPDERGLRPLILATRRVDVDRLNQLARLAMQGREPPGEPEVILGGRSFAVGDRVVALRNDRCFDVCNGTVGTLSTVDVESRILSVASDHDAMVRLPFSYAEAGHLDHGYAITLHKAQGTTVDHAFVLADEGWTRQTAYAALSRARHGTRLYLRDEPSLDDERHGPPPPSDDPIGRLTRLAERDRHQELALHHGGARLLPDHLLSAEILRLTTLKQTDPAGQLSAVEQELRDTARRRQMAAARVDTAELRHQQLGPLARRAKQGRHVDHDRVEALAALRGVDDDLRSLTERRAEVRRTSSTWRHEHKPDLDRLDDLRQEQLRRRLEQTLTQDRSAPHGLDQHLDITMGLER